MRYCPQCRAEYRDDVLTCSDDGATLVAGKPSEGAALPKVARLTSVLTMGDRFEAEELAEGLADEGMDVSLVSNRGQTLGNITEPGPEVYAIVVPDSDAERARALLMEWRAGYESQRLEAEDAAEREAAATVPNA